MPGADSGPCRTDAGAAIGQRRRYNRPAMIKSFVRTLRGPSSDPRMVHISRPMPRDLHDEQVLEALDLALATDPDPAYLVETLPAALEQVTGRRYEVLDRSSRDVTGAYVKTMVMIRDGSVGLWPGYAARAYPLLARDVRREETVAAIAAADDTPAPEPKAGWQPPPPRSRPPAREMPVGTADAGASQVQDAGPLDDESRGEARPGLR